jgi:ferredoxin-NADP reductase
MDHTALAKHVGLKPIMGGDCEANVRQLNIQRGRPDMQEILSAVTASGGAGPVAVFACGPDGMMQDTKNAVIALNRASGRDMSRHFMLHVEVFAF